MAAWPVVGGAGNIPNQNAQLKRAGPDQPTNLALGHHEARVHRNCRVLAAVCESLERFVDPPDRRAIRDWRPTDTHEIRDITHEADWK